MAKEERDKYLLKYEYDKFMEYCPQRHKLFFKVIAFGGLRISEALAITVNDILWEENKILITTLKRANHPKIPIIYSEKMIAEIKHRIVERKIKNRLFVYSRQYYHRIFKIVCKRAGLNPKYSPHALRHFAGMMIADITGGDMIQIKNRLRHTSVKSTEFYVHVSEKKQKGLSDSIEKYFENDFIDINNKK